MSHCFSDWLTYVGAGACPVSAYLLFQWVQGCLLITMILWIGLVLHEKCWEDKPIYLHIQVVWPFPVAWKFPQTFQQMTRKDLMTKGVTNMCLHWIEDKRLHQMIACLWLSSMSHGICNQTLAQMKKLAGFVRLSAVSGPQLSFGSTELPINNKYVVNLSGWEPAAYVLFFFLKWSMCVSRFSSFYTFWSVP